MPERSSIEAFVPSLRAVSAFLEELGLPSVIVGGIAFGIQAVPRATKDIDALVIDERLRADWIAEVAANHGFAPLADTSIESAKRTRVLKLRNVGTEVQVDVLIGFFPFEVSAAVRGQKMEFESIPLTVCRPEDLIVLKAFAGRLQDLADIDRLLETRVDLDRVYVERQVKALARLLEAPEIWSRIAELPGWAANS